MKKGECSLSVIENAIAQSFALNVLSLRFSPSRFQRSMTMLQVANKRKVECRNSLRKKLSAAMQLQKTKHQVPESLDGLVFYGSQLKRALLGCMPKMEGMDIDDEENDKSSSSRSKNSLTERALSASSRARR